MNAKNVVGLKSRLKLAQAAPPQLVYHGGPLIQNVKVVTLYWGSPWQNDPLRTDLDSFFDFIVNSSLVDQLSEYSVPGQTIGRGSHTASVFVSADPGPTIDDTQIQSFLQQNTGNGLLPAPDSNTVYFVFMPSGTTVTLQGSSSCQAFCGYHNVTQGGSIIYAVDTYDDCAGCQFVQGDLVASSTVVASHELCESITDPFLNAWFDDNTGEEIGDICEGSNKVINAAGTQDQAAGTTYTVTGNATAMADGSISATLSLTPTVTPPPPPPPPPTGQSWTVQKEWSNAQGACV